MESRKIEMESRMVQKKPGEFFTGPRENSNKNLSPYRFIISLWLAVPWLVFT